MKIGYGSGRYALILISASMTFTTGFPDAAIAREMLVPSDAIVISGPNNLADKINAADSALGDNAGNIIVETSGDVAKTIHLMPHHTLVFKSGVWKFTANSGIQFSSYSRIEGNGVGETILVLTNQSGSLIISSDYETLHGTHQDAILNPDSALVKKTNAKKNVTNHFLGTKLATVSNLTLSGTYQKGDKVGTATGIRIYGFWFKLSDLLVENFSGPGIVTEYISSGYTKGNDAAESFIENVKIMNNGGDGWVVRGSHDTMVNGLISALNGGWGLDVEHKEDYYSGGGLMLTNVHAYGNTLGGVRTQKGANILAFGLESEANHGPGVLLRSNDNVVHGEFYTNKSYGIQIGDDSFYSGANLIEAQLHNNGEAQIYFDKSAGYNYVTGVVYASGMQKYVLGTVTSDDVLSTVVGGLNKPAVPQQFQGKVRIDNKGNISGFRTTNGAPTATASKMPMPRITKRSSSAATLSVTLNGGTSCIPTAGASAHVSWVVRSKGISNVKVMVTSPNSDRAQLFSSGGRVGAAETGPWVRTGTRFDLVNTSTGALLATNVISASTCEN